jgi:hypothetical protein
MSDWPRDIPIYAALLPASRGWPVFGVRQHDKRPAVDRWQERATLDADIVRAYWQDHPTANIGIACGPAQLLVVDLDVKGDVDGITTFVLGIIPPPHGLPDTYTVETPSGGLHLYFATADGYRNTAGQLGLGVDTRAEGGYVLAAGSTTPAGPYRAVVDVDPQPVPGWLAQRLEPLRPIAPTTTREWSRRSRGWSGLVARVAVAPDGERNNCLNWAAYRLGEMVARGELDHAAAEMALDELHLAAVRSGLGEAEVAGTIASGFRSAT